MKKSFLSTSLILVCSLFIMQPGFAVVRSVCIKDGQEIEVHGSTPAETERNCEQAGGKTETIGGEIEFGHKATKNQTAEPKKVERDIPKSGTGGGW